MTATLQIPTTLIREMGQEIGFLREDIERLKRGNRATQLGNSSVENGSIFFYDEDGSLAAKYGKLAPGVYATEYFNQTAPSRPNTPNLEPFANGINVIWDGTFFDGQPIPKNFRFLEIYRGSTSTFIPGPDTYIGTMSEAGTWPDAGLASGNTYWYIFIATTNADKANGTGIRAEASTPSLPASATPDQVVADDILDGIVTEVKLAAEAVSQAKIKVGAVGTAQLGSQVVTLANLADGSVNALKLVDDSITGDKIAPLTITAAEISTNAITGPKIAASAIEADKIAANAVTANAIEAGAIVAGKIAANAVTAGTVAANAIGANEIAAGSIVAGKLAADSVGTNELIAGSISSNKIAADQILSTHIAANQVTASEIAALAIVAGKIDANAVTAGTIAAGAVTAVKLEANLVLASRIIAGNATGARVEMHPTSGLQAFLSNGTDRTFWINAATGELTAVGTWRTAFSGERFELIPPGTMNFWRSSGDRAYIINNGSELAFRGSQNTNSGHLRISANQVAIDYGNLAGQPVSSFLSNGSGIQQWGRLIGLRYENRYSGDGTIPRVFILPTFADGSDNGSANFHILNRGSYTTGNPDPGNPYGEYGASIVAPGENCGLAFNESIVAVTHGGLWGYGPIAASAFNVASSEETKEEIAEITFNENRTSWDMIEGAPSLDWKYLPTSRDDDPIVREPDGVTPQKVRRRNPNLPSYVTWETLPDDHPEKWVYVDWEKTSGQPARPKHRFPMAEHMLSIDENLVNTGVMAGRSDDKVVDLRDTIGIMWDAIDMLIKRNRLLEEQVMKQVKGVRLPKRPQKGDKRLGHNNSRVLDENGQVSGRAGEIVSASMSPITETNSGDSVYVRETSVDPIVQAGIGAIFARNGKLYWKNQAGQVKLVA